MLVGGVPMKNVCEETSAVAGAEPKSQLEPRHNGSRSGGGGRLWLWWDHDQHGLDQMMLLGQEDLLAADLRREWGGNKLAWSVNSWSRGQKVSDIQCVHKR